MGNTKTEDERIERVIRSLLKLPENRRCINCNLLGPQYVCTTFSTFVCTSCSGIHREFTHRVKSVSMAKFNPEEVTALQSGGNGRAKQIYFKEWDPLRHSYPDSGNIHKLREFIKQIYVERKFSGESSSSSLTKIKTNEKEDSYASKKSSSFRFEIMSPHSSPAPRSEDKNLRYLYDESRSPKYAQKYSRHGGTSRSPIQIEVVDDRFRDNDERRNRRLSNIESKLKQISFDGQKSVEKSQQPVVARPLEDMSRETAPPSLQVIHSDSKGSVEEKPSERKNKNPESSTNLSTKSQARHSAVGDAPEPPQITQSNDNNWANFGASTENNDPKTTNTNTSKPLLTKAASEAATPAKNPLDLLLFELSGPVAPVSSCMSLVPIGAYNNDPTSATAENSNTWDFPSTSIVQTTAPPNNASVWSFTSTPATEVAQPSNEVPPQTEVSHAHQPSSMQYLWSVSADCSSTTQPINSPVKDIAKNNQPSVAPSTNNSSWAFPEQSSQTTSSMQYLPSADSSITQPINSQVKDLSSNNHPSVAPSTNNSPWGFTGLSSQTTSKPTQETRPDAGSQPSEKETRPCGRLELPEDLFTSSYLSGPAATLAGWQNVQPHQGMGYGMQYYPNAETPPGLPKSPKSSNPFDLTDGRSLSHASSLPAMASLQYVQPAVSSRPGLMHASSFGSLGTMASQSPCYASPAPMGGYQANNNKVQPTRRQRAESFNSELSAFGSLGPPIQQSNSFSNTRGNPFD